MEAACSDISSGPAEVSNCTTPSKVSVCRKPASGSNQTSLCERISVRSPVSRSTSVRGSSPS